MECLNPRYLHKQDMVVPCGRCPMCAATKRSDWATRLHYEAKLHLVKKFVTLTYANHKLRWKNGVSQLCKRDLQLWLKRIRRAGFKCRYYAVGEYGSTTYRPHYHVILFGDVPDNVIRESWCDEKVGDGAVLGHVHIGNVTQSSIMYTLGYIVNGKGWQMRNGARVPPFSLMSRRPGLGASYLSRDMIDWHRSDRKNYTMVDGEKRHLPRYYKTKIFSKIDLVRIAVRDQKQLFKRMVEWCRHPARRRMKDPLEYRRLQMRNTAKSILFHSKENLTI